MKELIVRNVKYEDLRAVAEIAIRGWQTAYRGIVDDEYLDSLSIEENYQKQIKDYKENGFIVAEQEGEVVGFCRYIVGNNYQDEYPEVDCELCALYVKPEEKRNGIGRALVEYVKNEFRRNNLNKMIIWCFKDNYPSRAFYEKMGGELCGETTCIRGREYLEVGFIYNLNEKFKLIKPSLEYKEAATQYINEFYEYKSQIHGLGGLDIALEKGLTYEEWTENSIKMHDKKYAYSKEKVPAVTYFLLRQNDNRIVGSIDLRFELNDYLRNYGGHIGYSIRPTERRKGYNKINLYLCLLEAQKNGLDKVLITCADYNEGSRNSIKSFDGVLERTTYDESDGETMELYWIDVNIAINKYRSDFEKFI